MRTSRLMMFAALTALAAVAGCGNSGGAQPSASPPPVTSPIAITRTGGIAGVNQVITIDPDGTWVYTDKRASATQQGVLTASQRAAVQAAVAAPSFTTELGKAPAKTDCADTFKYTIVVGARSATFDDCDRDNRPAVMAALAAISDATPF